MESELEKAQRRLLECCAFAAHCDVSDFPLNTLRELAQDWELAKIFDTAKKIA